MNEYEINMPSVSLHRSIIFATIVVKCEKDNSDSILTDKYHTTYVEGRLTFAYYLRMCMCVYICVYMYIICI